MLYPVTWGKEAGASVFSMFIGILLSGIVLPVLAYVAMSRGNGNFYTISNRAAGKFGRIFCGITAIVIGPLYVIPRMSAAAWDALIQLIGKTPSSILPALIFTVLYYTAVYFFVSSKSKTVERVGNLLFPILIVLVLLIIFKGLVTPINSSRPASSVDTNPVLYGFLQGYATGDLQCALLFGLVIINGVRNAGIEEKRIPINMVKVGIVGFAMLACTHLGHMLIGSVIGDTIKLTLSKLYTEVVLLLWGRVGGYFFCFALVVAALTTAIGLTASTSEYWESALSQKWSYRKIVIVTSIGSGLLSLMGLDTIVRVVGPILDACYPGAIVLVVYYVFMPKWEDASRMKALKWAIITATAFGLLGALSVFCDMFNILPAYKYFYEMIPLAKANLAWVPAAIIVFIIIMLVENNRKRTKSVIPFS